MLYQESNYGNKQTCYKRRWQIMARYESGDTVFTRKAKGYDKIYGFRDCKKRFGRKDIEEVYLPEGLEGCVEWCNSDMTRCQVLFPTWGGIWIYTLFLTKGTPLEDAEKGTESRKKVQGEPSKADFIVDEDGQASHFKEKSKVNEPIVLAPIEVPESLTSRSVVKHGQDFLSKLYENERTEAETELIKEVTKDIKDERQRRRWWWF
jgi:hypothetical protein